MQDTVTPMLRQYQEIKEQHKDAVLMVRIGDFYEMFFDDAVVASKILEIVLTSRNRNDENPVPLCGVPYHSVEPYIARLIQAGCKVAICDQVEDPRSAKGVVVRREVTRVITPGLVLDPQNAKETSYLASVYPGKEKWGVSFLEFSTGDFFVTELSPEEAVQELGQRRVKEMILPEGLVPEVCPLSFSGLVNRLPEWVFDPAYTRKLLLEQFRVGSLSGFDCEDLPVGIRAAGAALHYARETQKTQNLPHLFQLKRLRRGDRLLYSEETRQSLEVDRLIELLDKTETAMGARLLREWVLNPLTHIEGIEKRQGAIEEILASPVRPEIRTSLKKVYDLERIAAKLSMKSANARDLIALLVSLEALEEMKPSLGRFCSDRLGELTREWDPLPEIAQPIRKSIAPEPPFSLREGGLIAEGVSPELDELRKMSHSGKGYLAEIEKREKARTGISSLKIRYNRVFGYYIEVTSSHLDKIPPDYIRKQTLTNAERYLTPELKELEGRILGAEEKAKNLEYEIFCTLRNVVAGAVVRIKSAAVRVAEVDLLVSLALVAQERDYHRPQMTNDPILEIRGGRHPLVEASLPAGRFVENDITLNPEGERLLLITGPNMAGKSTVIRQVGLIVLMAQVGSFVPAASAVIGIADRLFSRIGASDRLLSGESTFMVEMTETASLLRYATGRSLVLLDEIGRGTSTFDGLSIAWAISEYLHDETRARTLFATHYHELVDLALVKTGIRNYHAAVKEEGEEIVFLYKLVPGGTSHSYGIHVARLAGLPPTVVERASEILKNLEQGEYEKGAPRIGKRQKKAAGQTSLF